MVTGYARSDDVRLLASGPKPVALSHMVQGLKGRSRRHLMDGFGELSRQYSERCKGARGCVAVSTGKVTNEIIQRYIDSHEDMPEP